jgi:hypothetical protein
VDIGRKHWRLSSRNLTLDDSSVRLHDLLHDSSARTHLGPVPMSLVSVYRDWQVGTTVCIG